MGILRKYLCLVLPIVFFANYANADTCENDPYACTPAKLCSKTTEKINNVLYWISSEEDKHLKVARKINLNCGAKDAMSSCQKDASECSILELCEVAVTKEVSATNWNEINPQHVKLAKSFGLDCGVSHSAVSNTSTSPCDENPSACISEALCEKATHDGFGKKEWRTGYYKNYVKEAKQRGLTCGVKSTSIDKTCSQDVLKCTPSELCDAATYTINKTTDWKVGAYKKYVKEAKRRNISCGVKSTSNDKTCSQDVLICTPSELCDAASYTINGITGWKVGAYKKYVKEAKRRNISCGVKSANNKQVKADEKARLALQEENTPFSSVVDQQILAYKAEVKRRATEKKLKRARARIARRAQNRETGGIKYYMKWVNRLSDCSSTSRSAYNYEFKNNLLYVVGQRVDVERLGDYQITDNSIYLGVESRFYSTGVYIGLAKNQESQTNKKWQFKHIRQNKKTYNTETNYEYLYLCK